MSKKIDRQGSLELLKGKIDKVYSHSRVFDSDGDVDDEGACEYIAEIDFVVEAIEANKSDEEIIKAADWVGMPLVFA